ncbi:MAG: hypothetical protein ACPG7F_01530 [Aggregatilineales bacterium]
MKSIMIIGMLVLISACSALAPAETPPQLEMTPGYMMQLDDRYYETASFRLRYPPGWTIIKSNISVGAAEVYFISSDAPDDPDEIDETMEIFVFITPRPAPDIPDGMIFIEEQVEFDNGDIIFIRGTTPENQESDLRTAMNNLITSLEQPANGDDL